MSADHIRAIHGPLGTARQGVLALTLDELEALRDAIRAHEGEDFSKWDRMMRSLYGRIDSIIVQIHEEGG